MARTSGRGGMVAISGGSPTAVPEPADHEDNHAYVLDEIVKVTTSSNTSYAVCVINHTSAASDGITAGANGAIAGADAANWRVMPQGNLSALRNWSFDTSETTSQESYVNETEDRTVGTTVATTGQIVVADNDEDGFDVAQRALTVGNQFTLRLYPRPAGPHETPKTYLPKTGDAVFTGVARITGESGAFATNVQERTFAFAIQGSWTRSRVA